MKKYSMNEKLKKYIKREEYNPDNDKTEIWIGEFSNAPIDPINVISEIISNFNSKNYKIIVDDYLLYNNRGNWRSPIIFNNITFNKGIEFKFYSFDDNVSFINCIFGEAVIFGKSVLKKDISFVNCIFKGNTNFWGTVFYSTVVFSESKFQGEDNNFWQANFYEDVFCENINVRSNINFSDTIFEENAYFKGAILKGKINFTNVKFKNVQKDNIKEKQKKEIDFSRVLFGVVTFNNTKFEKNVRFHEAIFNSNVDFSNTSFNGLADFYLVTFKNDQQFHTTDFLDRAIFSNTTFKGETQFIYNKVDKNSYINFESAKFEKGLDISRANFNCNLNFWNIFIQDKNISKFTRYKDDFSKHRKEGTVPSVYKQIRETYRIIKDNFYKQNNKVEGLRFYEKEMSVYLEEKRAEDEKTEGFFSDVSTKVIKIKDQIKDQIKKASYNLQPFFTKLKNNTIFVLFLIILYIPLSLIAILLSPIYTIPVIIDRITRMGIKYALLFFINVVSLSLYMIEKSYYWFWLLALALILLVLLKFYENRKSTREIVKQNNYISPLLLFIMTIIFLVIIYGQEDFKNDWAYKTIHWFLLQILNDQLGLSIVIMIALMSFAMLFIVVLREHDKITLWFNKNSNEFDTNWIAGVNFSILVGFITYFMVLLFMNNDIELDTSTEGISNFITSLVDVFNLTKWVNLEIIDIRLEGFPYLLLFIGRIFIGYGYYQTIQAFRKFGKS